MKTTDKIASLMEKLASHHEGMASTCGKQFVSYLQKASVVTGKIKDVLRESNRHPAVKAAAAILEKADEETREWLEDNSFMMYGSLEYIARRYCPDLTDNDIDLIDWAIDIQMQE